MAIDLRVKRVYEPASDEDGTRVLVDRLWPRGRTRRAAAVAVWLKAIAPSAALRKWFHHDPARWSEFRKRYRAELDENWDAVARLRDLIGGGRVTLLYGLRDTEHNHALILAEYCRRRFGRAGKRRKAAVTRKRKTKRKASR